MPAGTAERPVTGERGSARERLLDAADQLFYEEGVHTVGIDRVIERAGVAKASLYNTFGSKEELIRAYLERRHERRRARVERNLERFTEPRDRLLGVFDAIGELATEPGFRGCAFINASAEGRPGDAIQGVCDNTRSWIRALFTDLAREAGVPDPEHLARQLVLLYDGATVGAQMDRDPASAVAARAVAATLVDAALTT